MIFQMAVCTYFCESKIMTEMRTIRMTDYILSQPSYQAVKTKYYISIAFSFVVIHFSIYHTGSKYLFI